MARMDDRGLARGNPRACWSVGQDPFLEYKAPPASFPDRAPSFLWLISWAGNADNSEPCLVSAQIVCPV